jgi:hypothetical protein
MSTRERWIVYPLLFLTLGIALRDKIVPPDLKPLSVDADAIRCRDLDVDTVRCRALTVVNGKNNRCMELGATTAGSGQLELFGLGGKMIFVAGAEKRGGSGLCQIADAEGRARAQLCSNPAGGMLSLTDPTNKIEVVLGHDGQGFSMVGNLLDTDQTIPLTLPCRWKDVPRKSTTQNETTNNRRD